VSEPDDFGYFVGSQLHAFQVVAKLIELHDNLLPEGNRLLPEGNRVAYLLFRSDCPPTQLRQQRQIVGISLPLGPVWVVEMRIVPGTPPPGRAGSGDPRGASRPVVIYFCYVDNLQIMCRF